MCYNRDTSSLDRFQAQPIWEMSVYSISPDDPHWSWIVVNGLPTGAVGGHVLARRVTLAGSGEISGDVRLGAVYEYRQMLRIAAGMDRQKLSAGIGLMTGRFGLDYAFWRDTDIDNTHRISVSMNL